MADWLSKLGTQMQLFGNRLDGNQGAVNSILAAQSAEEQARQQAGVFSQLLAQQQDRQAGENFQQVLNNQPQTQGNQYQDALLRLAQISPQQYGAAALQQLDPLTELDMKVKRAELENQLKPKREKLQIEKLDDGTIVAIDPYTGQAAPIYQGTKKPTPQSPEGKLAADVASGLIPPQTTPAVKGREQFDQILSRLDMLRQKLRDEGVSTSENDNAISNIANRTANTWLGQAAGKALSTPEQTLRDQFEAEKQKLVSAYKSASGTTGGQMNSEKELEQFLKALPQLSNSDEANAAIIKSLGQTYGSGSASPSTNAGDSNPVGTRAIVNGATYEKQADGKYKKVAQ